jgi:phenylalanyl-tRNA synthetase beta chain
VAMGNPLSEEAGMLRPSLVPGMLAMLALNLNRNAAEVQLFEKGAVFSGDPEHVEERPALALGAFSQEMNFYVLKGTIEELVGKFATRSISFDTFPPGVGITPTWLHPGRSARVVMDGLTLGWFGQLHPAEAQQRKLRQDVYVGEIYLDRLDRFSLRQPIAPELSRYQAVERDFSFVFADTVRWQAIADALNNLKIGEMIAFAPREVFRGTQSLPAGHYSMLIRATFQALDRTLREEELQAYAASIATVLVSLGGKQRA